MNSPSTRRNHWKLRLGALGLGLLVAAIIFGTTLAIFG
jgi:hypothetical protein